MLNTRTTTTEKESIHSGWHAIWIANQEAQGTSVRLKSIAQTGSMPVYMLRLRLEWAPVSEARGGRKRTARLPGPGDSGGRRGVRVSGDKCLRGADSEARRLPHRGHDTA
jgi:hypothetical protein